MIYKNKNHWNRFYIKFKKRDPSSFAKLIFKKFLKNNSKKNLIDIGCGNGRDAFFFSGKLNSVIGLDKSSIVIKNNKIYSKKIKVNNINFIKSDVNNKNILDKKKFDYIYLRFFLHSINNESQKKLLKLLKRLSKKNKSLIMFEFRTTKDSLMNKGEFVGQYERVTDHYRRFIETKKFINEFKKSIKSKLIYRHEAQNISKFKNDNPHLCRLVFKIK